MKLWLIINHHDRVTEDTAYIVGRIAARIPEILVSHVDCDAMEVPDPPEGASVVFCRHAGYRPEFFLSLKEKAETAGIPVSNPPEAAIRANDKRTLIEDFPDLTPPTRVAGNLGDFREAFNEFGGDVVIKEPFGYHGSQVKRITSLQAQQVASDLLAESVDGEIVVQPYFSGFSEGDCRAITVRDQSSRHRIIASFKRYPGPGQWRCNLSQGGRCLIGDLNRAEADLALEVAERSGLDFGQLDFGWHQGRFYLIETNQVGGGLIDFDIGHRANCADSVAEFVEARARA